MRLAWFSPLAPAPSAIGVYTAQLLPLLARQHEVELWTDAEAWDPALETWARVRRYHPESPDWRALNRADLAVYHLGNEATFHGGIWQVSQAHPGLVVLHDLRLHHLFGGLLVGLKRDREAYLSLLLRHHGGAAARAGQKYWQGALSDEHMGERWPLTAAAVDQALGVLTHDPQAVAGIEALGRFPVRVAALPYAARPLDPSAPRPAPPWRLVVFGHLGPNRRLAALLEALADPRLRRKFVLDIYGRLPDPEDERRRIDRLGLGDVVRIAGFVGAAELDRALAGAHLAINLRHPTMGEASWSQLHLWEHRLPSLVSRSGWYAGLPETAVHFIRPENEVEDLRAALAAFLAAPERFRAQGEAGRRLLEQQHDPQAYVAALGQLAAAAVRHRPRALSERLGRRVAEELSHWTGLAGAPASATIRAALDRIDPADQDAGARLGRAAEESARAVERQAAAVAAEIGARLLAQSEPWAAEAAGRTDEAAGAAAGEPEASPRPPARRPRRSS